MSDGCLVDRRTHSGLDRAMLTTHSTILVIYVNGKMLKRDGCRV